MALGKMRDRRNNPRMDVEGPAPRQNKCSLTIPRGEHSSIRLMIGLESRCIGASA
jgi:hypothetical protein